MSDSMKKNIQLIIDGLYNNSKLLLETKEIQNLKEYELDITIYYFSTINMEKTQLKQKKRNIYIFKLLIF